MVCIAGTDGYFRQLNPTFELVLGHTREELMERSFFEFVHPADFKPTLAVLEKLAQGESTIDFENRYRCKDGSYKWLSWHASPGGDGSIYALARDVTERRATQERLAAMAEDLRVMAVVDELTGLHNRRGFNILVDQELKRARRGRQKATFFFADVDGLKQVNDALGHEFGDRAICDAASALRSVFRKSDIVARTGGDEFAILCTDGAIEPTAPVTRLEEVIHQYNAFNSAAPLHPLHQHRVHDPRSGTDRVARHHSQARRQEDGREQGPPEGSRPGGKHGRRRPPGQVGGARRLSGEPGLLLRGDLDRLDDPVTVDHGGDGGLVVEKIRPEVHAHLVGAHPAVLLAHDPGVLGLVLAEDVAHRPVVVRDVDHLAVAEQLDQIPVRSLQRRSTRNSKRSGSRTMRKIESGGGGGVADTVNVTESLWKFSSNTVRVTS